MASPTLQSDPRPVLRATPQYSSGSGEPGGTAATTPLIVAQEPPSDGKGRPPSPTAPLPHIPSSPGLSGMYGRNSNSYRVRFDAHNGTTKYDSFTDSVNGLRSVVDEEIARRTSNLAPKGAGNERPTATVISPTKDPDEDDKVSVVSGDSDLSQETTTSAASSARVAARNAGITRFRICGYTIRVSFVAWTFVAMAVPIIFLVAAMASDTAAAAVQLSTIKRHVRLADLGSDCVSAISEEHARTLRYVLRRDAASRDAMEERRANFLQQCTEAFQTELLFLRADNDIFAEAFQDWTVVARDIAIVRERIDNLPANMTRERRASIAPELRDSFDSTSRIVTDAVSIAADLVRTDDTRFFLNIKLSADARKSIWTAIASTLVVAGSEQTPAELVDEFVAAESARRAARTSLRALRGIASPALREDVLEWDARPEVRALWRTMDDIQEVYAELAPEDFWNSARVAMTYARRIENAQIARLERAKSAIATLAENVSLMVTGVVACLVAGGLLSWQQLRTKDQLEDQVERVEKTRKAVSAFVPKFFLSKMGYTSITQVQVGESTDVALAMLFADIRKFTTVSEGMASAALFQWVQGYFQRMTVIVELHRGNINQFIGDALFAVFSTCTDAVSCAVGMQSDAQQLNLERLCEERNPTPVEIGVGLHHDVLAMGILGDEHRHTCTAISASVNLASRLEGLTKQLGCRILASEAVISQLSPADQEALAYRRVGPAIVKGSCHDVVVYDVFQTDDRNLQAYKAATKDDFERYARMVLEPGSAAQAVASLSCIADDLHSALARAAAEHNAVDGVLDQMLKHRDPKTGSMAFDEK